MLSKGDRVHGSHSCWRADLPNWCPGHHRTDCSLSFCDLHSEVKAVRWVSWQPSVRLCCLGSCSVALLALSILLVYTCILKLDVVYVVLPHLVSLSYSSLAQFHFLSPNYRSFALFFTGYNFPVSLFMMV